MLGPAREGAMPARILVLVLLAAPFAKAQAVSPWEVGAAAGFASIGVIKGPTGGVSVVRSVNNWLAPEGTFPTVGGAYGYAIPSTSITPPWSGVRQLHSYDTQCGYGSAFNLRLGAGLAFAASNSVLL